MPRLASDRLCTGCLVCVDTCKHQAIGIINKEWVDSRLYMFRQMRQL